jgi:exonuclease SbcD
MTTPRTPLRVAHLTDLHLTEDSRRPWRLADQAEDLERVTTAILETRPHLVLLTGDFYGRTVPHRPSPLERAVLEPAIVRLAEAAPVVVLEGNHDHGEALGLASLLGGAYPIRVVRGAEAFTVHTEAGPVAMFGLAYPSKRWLVAQAGALGRLEAQDATSGALAAILRSWAGRIDRQRKRAPEVPIIALAHATITGSILAGSFIADGHDVEVPPELLTAMAVDYGALGHIHQRQELAARWWYAGDPWCVDFGERGPKGWNQVEIGATARPGPGVSNYQAGGGLQAAAVTFRDSGSRPWRTLDYCWALDPETGEARWFSYPEAAELAQVAGAEVRARLVATDQAVASCPWAAELQRLRELGAHQVEPEQAVIPTMRVRAPEVAAAQDLPGKAGAYWSTLTAQPAELERDAALGALGELETMTDDQIDRLTGELLASVGL